MKPILNVRESYSAMSFIDAAGGSSHRHQSAIVQELSPRNRRLRQTPLRGMRMCRTKHQAPSTKHQAPTGPTPSNSPGTTQQLLHAVFDLDFMRPAEGVELRNIDQLAHRAVRLGGVELHRPLEAHGPHHQLRQFADGQLLAGAHIDVAIADLAQRRDVPAAARRVVAVHDAVVPGLSPRNRCKRQM